LNFVFGGLLNYSFRKEEGRRRRCGSGGKVGAVFCEGFSKQLVGIIKKKPERRTGAANRGKSYSASKAAARHVYAGTNWEIGFNKAINMRAARTPK
jgi:hypothetical protein